MHYVVTKNKTAHEYATTVYIYKYIQVQFTPHKMLRNKTQTVVLNYISTFEIFVN